MPADDRSFPLVLARRWHDRQNRNVIQDFTLGYPVDLRSPERRRRWAEGSVGDFEGMAARVVARLTGERVVIQDDGSKPAMADIRIDYADKPVAYVEVVVDIEGSYAAMEWEIWRRASSMPADRCWQVSVSGSSRPLKTLRQELPVILGSLHHPPGPREAQQLASLGVRVTGHWMPRPGETGAIELLPEGILGPAELEWEPFLNWINAFLVSRRAADVREKLAATGAAERHAFIGVSFTTPGSAYFALREEGWPRLPSHNPTLPPEITHLWIWSVRGIERCLAWFPDTGWLDPIDHWSTA